MSTEPYTRNESLADAEAWTAATDEQRSAAFWAVRAIVAADAQAGDEYCTNRLRELAADRDRSKS